MLRRLICAAAMVVAACRTETPRRSFQLATTTSVENSGLLRVLAARFEQRSGIAVHPFVVGSGKALKMAEAGEVEVTITHDPEAEGAFVAAQRPELYRQFMWNDFVIAGPPDDPAGARQARSAVDAFARIHRARAKFASRNDRSGTHTAELRLWRDAGADPAANPHYLRLGQSMASLLRSASELQAYALTDRATYDALAPSLELRVLFEGDPRLRNVYALTLVRRDRDTQNHRDARRFAQWLLSAEGRQAVEQFAVAGKRQFRWIDG
ncbi:MAG: substrate-binding domain-containing protein [Acidobacteriota bacterium]